jgi:hypothetical protein
MITVNPTVWTTSFSFYTHEPRHQHLPDLNGGRRVLGPPMMMRESRSFHGEYEFYFQSIRDWVRQCNLYPVSE